VHGRIHNLWGLLHNAVHCSQLATSARSARATRRARAPVDRPIGFGYSGATARVL
jgi:hypothetical protein